MSSRTVPFFNYPQVYLENEAAHGAALIDVCRRGAFIMQAELLAFEEELASYAGSGHAIGVADGTMALLLSLKTLGLKSGDEVIVPSHTFVASAAAIHHAGGKPVLADCGPDHLIDPASVARAITDRTRGIMPVQLNGRVANMDELLEIAERHGLFIVEDSCQSLGAKFKGQQAGTFGTAGAISFYPSKTLGCFGDGGAILTNDDETASKLRLLRDHGRDDEGEIRIWGYNSRLDNLQAAILRLKLRKYDETIARRRSIARIYNERLQSIDQLLLPPAPDSDDARFDIFQNYEIEAESRDELRAFLSEQGVGTILQWGGKAIHQFRDLGLNANVPYTSRMVDRFLLLPMNTSLSDDDVHYVCDQVCTFYSGAGSTQHS